MRPKLLLSVVLIGALMSLVNLVGAAAASTPNAFAVSDVSMSSVTREAGVTTKCGSFKGGTTDITATGVSCAVVLGMMRSLATGKGTGFEGWTCGDHLTNGEYPQVWVCRRGGAKIDYDFNPTKEK